MIIQHLANLPSSCPADSSSLESCISALKSSISALESCLKATEGSSGRWEMVGWLCAIAVGIGIAGEILVIVSEHLEALEDWRGGIIRPPDCPPSWRFWVDIVATVVVLGGVFGEAGASAEIASINSQLRSKTSELRGISDRLLAVITEEAGDAATSAKRAKDAADAAEQKLKVVSGRAAQIEASLDAVRWVVSARRIQDEEGLEADLAKSFKGKSITFKSYATNPSDDGFWLCVQLLKIAHNAEVLAKDECAQEPLPRVPVTDLLLSAPTLEEAESLIPLLKKPGRVPGLLVTFREGPEFTVLIGTKPSIPLWPKKTQATKTKSH